MRSAKEPFGGGLEEVGAALVAAGLDTVADAGADLEAIDLATAGFVAADFGGAALAGGAVSVGAVLLLTTGFGEAGVTVVDGAPLGIMLDVVEEAAGLVEGTLLIGWLSRLSGRASWSSALRFIPVPAFPAGRGARGSALNGLSSLLVVEDGAGIAGG